MSVSEIIGVVMACLALSALIVWLFIVTMPIVKIEHKERKAKTKLYATLTKYLEFLMIDYTKSE